MLPKLERLKDKYLFNLAFNVGKKRKQKLNSNLLSLYYLFKKKDINKLNEKTILPKAAFIVGLKIDKRSSKRNLIKRRMREAYRLVTKSLYNQIKDKLFVLIWVANPNIKSATYGQIQTSIEGMLKRLL